MQYRILGKTGLKVSAVSYGGIVSAGLYGGVNYESEDQAASVRALMREGQLQDVFSVQDTAGIERVVVGRRPKD